MNIFSRWFFPAPAFPLRSAAAQWSAPHAARFDPPGTHPGKEHEGEFPATATSGPWNGPWEARSAACDEEPATKSRASLSHQPSKRDQGDGAEHGRPSTIPREPTTSGAEAATERSEGVAGAERYQGPGQTAAGRALAASEASSGQGRRLALMVDFTFTPHEAESEYPTYKMQNYEWGSSPHSVSKLRIIIDLAFEWNRYVGMPLSSLPGYISCNRFEGTSSDAVNNGKRWTILCR